MHADCRAVYALVSATPHRLVRVPGDASADAAPEESEAGIPKAYRLAGDDRFLYYSATSGAGRVDKESPWPGALEPLLTGGDFSGIATDERHLYIGDIQSRTILRILK
jgi:hypothetical protein